MALATAPNKRELKSLMRWQERDRRLSRESSLEHIARQASHTNGHDANIAYVLILPEISASSPIQNGMTAAEWKNHWKSVDEFNEWYANKGIEQVVENTHAGLFGSIARKVYDVAAYGLSYFGNIAGKAVSLIPQPARRGLVPTGLATSLIFTACEFGPKPAYADVRLTSSNVSYDSESNLVQFIVVADYTSESKQPVEGIVSVYLDNKLLVSQKGVLNPEKGADFTIQASLPPGTYNFRIQVDAPGIKEANYGNNARGVVLNATPTPLKSAPTPGNTPTAFPKPTLETKLFEFIFPSSTPEQYETFSRNALEDYRKVLGVYGIKEEDARMVVSVGKRGYGAGFY